MTHADFVVLKQDAMGLASNGAHASKGHDVAFGHHGTANVRVEFAIVVNDGVKLFFISGFEGRFVLGKDAHGCPSASHHITTSFPVHGASWSAGTFEAC